MLKYVDTKVTFSEIPDEITLCINLSNCPCHCEGCHSSYLGEDIGNVLTYSRIEKLLEENKGVTAICFMGGDNDPKLVNHYANLIRQSFISMPFIYPDSCVGRMTLERFCPNPIKIGWYSGRQELSKEIDINNFDIIKLGGYMKKLGPLTSSTTNQKFYKVINNSLFDYTYLFWKNSNIEIWRDIEGFNGYQVSNLGNIRSLNYNGKGIIKNLKPCKSGPNKSYLSVAMQVGKKVIRKNIHRLVAAAFIPNPDKFPEINHIDEDGTNNKVNNLEWCNRIYNLSYGTRTQRFIDSKSIPILQCDLEGNIIKEWKSQTEICKELSLDSGSLSHCLHGYRIKKGKRFPVYSYAGYKWKYKK